MIGAETASILSRRGIYRDDEKRGYVNAYGTTLPSSGASAEASWRFWASRPCVGGVFVWPGSDYRGEPTPFGWPAVVTSFGIVDICGLPKDDYYYHKSWWTGCALTVECRFLSQTKAGLRLHIRSSYDGIAYDSHDLYTFCFEASAGETARRTGELAPKARFFKVTCEDLDGFGDISLPRVTAPVYYPHLHSGREMW